ncbi:hypothetical protein H257_03348 [Aphanomyces astaci]|uniref:Uncharacterized protein n=1 Tax=Aphanomyces astaci TaxID=112090 RepID=W4GY82_APHAT|nr:hypothetical protein H257_03348 [Aphanomyces astaci]ETV83984.1 hypothetical protein H257_03348 [Aphanomyces astaci]|eukprot:XP_009825676.1 hypothetical protein H257_03348 [Aphanomyces astaci]
MENVCGESFPNQHVRLSTFAATITTYFAVSTRASRIQCPAHGCDGGDETCKKNDVSSGIVLSKVCVVSTMAAGFGLSVEQVVAKGQTNILCFNQQRNVFYGQCGYSLLVLCIVLVTIALVRMLVCSHGRKELGMGQLILIRDRPRFNGLSFLLHPHCNLCPTSTPTSTKPATLAFPSAATSSPLTVCPPRVKLETISPTPVTRAFASFASMGTDC